jgi:hypothetical protein
MKGNSWRLQKFVEVLLLLRLAGLVVKLALPILLRHLSEPLVRHPADSQVQQQAVQPANKGPLDRGDRHLRDVA